MTSEKRFAPTPESAMPAHRHDRLRSVFPVGNSFPLPAQFKEFQAALGPTNGWPMAGTLLWNAEHQEEPTDVVFVPGNHDEFARQFDGHDFGGIQVRHEAVHTTATGQRLWVVHGDHFDGVIQCAKWLAYLGDNLYEFTLRLNRHLNSLRARLGLPYWSLSQYLKHKVKSALNHVTDFERAVAAEARRRGFDGVVCGHIHRAEMRTIDGTLCCNDGDWVESMTALVERRDGSLALLHWQPTSRTPSAVQQTTAAKGEAA